MHMHREIEAWNWACTCILIDMFNMPPLNNLSILPFRKLSQHIGPSALDVQLTLILLAFLASTCRGIWDDALAAGLSSSHHTV